MALIPGTVAAHEKGDEAKPPPPVRMQIIAPSAKGPWLLRIDNEGDGQVRIAADVRLLTFTVRAPAERKTKVGYTHGFGWKRRTATCNGPKQFGLTKRFPANRELVLDPGHSYVEEFDPRLICFGKNAEVLRPGAKVKATLGWTPKPRWSRRMEAAPFAADDAQQPRQYRPLRRLEAATFILSHGGPVEYGVAPLGNAKDASDKQLSPAERRAAGIKRPRRKPTEDAADEKEEPTPKPKSAEEASRYRPAPPPPKRPKPATIDELSAALTLTASHYADAARPTQIQLSVEAHNTGQRPIFVAMRSRMLSFVVHGPDGLTKCRRDTAQHHVPKDLFSTLHHGKHRHMSVLLAEVCPPRTFDRPGLYVAAPILHADANGKEYGFNAVTGVVTSREPGKVGGTHQVTDDMTLVRVRFGRKPYHKAPPVQIPTRVLPK